MYISIVIFILGSALCGSAKVSGPTSRRVLVRSPGFPFFLPLLSRRWYGLYPLEPFRESEEEGSVSFFSLSRLRRSSSLFDASPLSLLVAMSTIIVGDIVPMKDRGTYQGLMGGVWGVSSVLGPLLGGILSDKPGGWRWCFFMSVSLSSSLVLPVD